MKKRFFTFIEFVLWRSWWIVLFILACCILLEHALLPKRIEYQKLLTHMTDLQNEKKQALNLQEDLLRQVNSESDPAWIELTLMKRLGLVPEEQTKVFFTSP